MADVINMFEYFSPTPPPSEPVTQVIDINEWLVG